jgi:4-amino-4-deoxy-L-arabinose transferase-like glycosyltransferase
VKANEPAAAGEYARAAPVPPRAWLVVFGVGLALVALKAPVLDLPFYWDEQAYVLPSAWLAHEGLVHVLPGLHPPGRFFGHPPLLYLLFAAQFAAFGETRWIPHAIVLAFALAATALTFAIGRRVRDAYAGIAAAAWLWATPIFTAQSVMVLADLVLAALGLLAVHLYLSGRRAGYWLTAAAMLLCKETSLAIVASCAAFAFFTARADRPAGRWRDAAFHLSPALVLAVFFATELWTAGTAVSNPYFARNSLVNPGLFDGETRHLIQSVVYWLALSQGKWVLGVLVAAGLVLGRRDVWRREFALFALVAAAFGGAFVVIFFLPRYLIPVLPFYCIAAACALSWLSRSRRGLRLVAPVAVTALLAMNAKTGCGEIGSRERDLCYVDAVRVDRAAAEWLARQPDGSSGAVPWSYLENLRQPVLGYLSQPAPIDARVVGSAGGPPDFAVLAPSAATRTEHEELQALVNDAGLAPLARFTSGRSIAEIYGRPEQSGR